MPRVSGGTRGRCAAWGELGHGSAVVQPGMLLNAGFPLRPAVASCEDPVPVLRVRPEGHGPCGLFRKARGTGVTQALGRGDGRSVMEQLRSVQALGDAEIIRQDIELFLSIEALEAFLVISPRCAVCFPPVRACEEKLMEEGYGGGSAPRDEPGGWG